MNDTYNTEKPSKQSVRMTQAEGDEISQVKEESQSKGSNEKQETLQQDETISNIQEWLLQERLLLQELKRFKPVKQPTNPNPPWEYYILRQKQLIVQMKQLRRRIEFIGKKDEYFIELQKYSTFANRLLELLNRGEFTDYAAAGNAIDDLLRETDISMPLQNENTGQPILYRAEKEEEVPDAYQEMIAGYFKRLSEE